MPAHPVSPHMIDTLARLESMAVGESLSQTSLLDDVPAPFRQSIVTGLAKMQRRLPRRGIARLEARVARAEGLGEGVTFVRIEPLA